MQTPAPLPSSLDSRIDFKERVALSPLSQAAGFRFIDGWKDNLILGLDADTCLSEGRENKRIGIGAMAALLDHGSGMALHLVHEGATQGTATVDLRIDVVRCPSPGESVAAHCSIDCVTGPFALVRGKVIEERTQELVATSIGTFMLDANRRPPFGQHDRPSPVKGGAQNAGDYLDFTGAVFGADFDTPDRLPFRESFVGNTTLGVLHGGFVAGFLQTCMASKVGIAVGRVPSDISPVSFTTEYLLPVAPEELSVVANIKRRGRRVVFIEVIGHQGGRSVVAGSGIFSVH